MPTKTLSNDQLYRLACSLGEFDALKVDGNRITLIQRSKVTADGLPAALARAKDGDQTVITRGPDGRFLVEIHRTITPPPAATE